MTEKEYEENVRQIEDMRSRRVIDDETYNQMLAELKKQMPQASAPAPQRTEIKPPPPPVTPAVTPPTAPQVFVDNQEYGNTSGNIANLGFIALKGEWLYYLIETKKGNNLYKINTDGKKQQKLNNDNSWYINVIGDWVYYSNLDDNYKIYKMSTDGKNRQKITDDDCGFLMAEGEWIYYSNGSDGVKIYKIRTDGTGRQKLNDDNSRYINVAGEWIYYVNIILKPDIDEDTFGFIEDSYASKSICRIRKDGTQRQELNDDMCGSINITNGWVYYTNESDGSCIYKIRTDGTERQKISEDKSFSIVVDGEWIYYTDANFGKSIYKIRTDGTGHQKLIDDDNNYINVAGDWVYYRGESTKNGKLWRIHTDGTGKQILK